jgi:hypothetical protein
VAVQHGVASSGFATPLDGDDRRVLLATRTGELVALDADARDQFRVTPTQNGEALAWVRTLEPDLLLASDGKVLYVLDGHGSEYWRSGVSSGMPGLADRALIYEADATGLSAYER